MHNLPISFISVLVVTLLIYARYGIGGSGWIAKLRTVLLPLEDQWTLTTRDGAVFEEVDVEDIAANEVVFHHKFGHAHLPITVLSEDSWRKLAAGYPGASLSADVTRRLALSPATLRREARRQEKPAFAARVRGRHRSFRGRGRAL